MAGIYIHIPFCRKACHYCNFHFSTQTQYIAPFTTALLNELAIQKDYLNTPIETIYFGGGTPSLLTQQHLESIMGQISKHYHLAETVECTLEANPDDINLEKMKAWKSIGINRLSLGIQSFQSKALAWMNRAHSVDQSHQAIQLAQKVGIMNLSIDLIYGTPHLTDEELIADLNTIKSYNIPHVSCYALTVEEKTALHKMIQQKKMGNIDAERQSTHFNIIVEHLEAQGMEHYEISNFGLKGHRSKHNSNYWKGVPYLGVGPSAHSFNTLSRQWNIANNQLYIQSITNGIVPFEIEALPLATRYNEYMMISLRCMEGFSNQTILDRFGADFLNHSLLVASNFETRGQLIKTATGFTLTKEAKFFADGIAADFFWID